MSAILVTFPGAPTVSEKAIEAVLTLYIILTCIQWNLSNTDTIGTDESVLYSEVSGVIRDRQKFPVYSSVPSIL